MGLDGDANDASDNPLATVAPTWVTTIAAAGPLAMEATPDGRLVVVGMIHASNRLGSVRVLDAITGDVLMADSYPFDLCCALPPVAIDQDGDRVVAGGNTVLLYDVTTGDRIVSFDLDQDGEKWPEVAVTVDLTPDGERIVFPTWQANRLIAVTTEERHSWATPFGDGEEFAEARFSRDGRRVALASNSQLSVHDAETGLLLDRHDAPAGAESVTPSVVISSDGSALATIFRIQDSLTLAAYEPGTPSPRWTRSLGVDEYWGGVHMSPEGELIGAWSPSGSLVVDGSGQLVAPFPGARIRSFVPIAAGALALVEDSDSLQVVHVAKGLVKIHGAVPKPDAFVDAILTRGGILTVSAPVDEGKRTATIVELFPVDDLPYEEAVPHGA